LDRLVRTIGGKLMATTVNPAREVLTCSVTITREIADTHESAVRRDGSANLPVEILRRYHDLVDRKHTDGLTINEQREFDQLAQQLDEADRTSPAEWAMREAEERRHTEQMGTLDSILDQLRRLQSI
jgi:hypothetical protein